MVQFCKLCRRRTSGKEYHEKCERTKFQLDEIIDIYKKGEPPSWLVEAICEFSWIYYDNVRTSAFFNVASEIAECFILGDSEKIDRSEIRELCYSGIPEGEILELSQEGKIITYDEEYIYPAEIINRAKDIVEKGYELDSKESELKRKEMFGFLTVCLTKSLINSTNYGIPRTALSTFHLLSEQMREAKDDEDEITDTRIFNAFSGLSTRQQERKMRRMAGFDPSGTPKIIRDIDMWGTPHLKLCMVEYVNNMRERFRLRSRDSRDREI